jgi:hypothetical protein
VTKICESSVGGFAQVGRNPHRQELAVQDVSHSVRVHQVVEPYGRFMGGSDRNTSNSGRFGQTVQFMQMAQRRINTGYFASC